MPVTTQQSFPVRFPGEPSLVVSQHPVSPCQIPWIPFSFRLALLSPGLPVFSLFQSFSIFTFLFLPFLQTRFFSFSRPAFFFSFLFCLSLVLKGFLVSLSFLFLISFESFIRSYLFFFDPLKGLPPWIIGSASIVQRVSTIRTLTLIQQHNRSLHWGVKTSTDWMFSN